MPFTRCFRLGIMPRRNISVACSNALCRPGAAAVGPCSPPLRRCRRRPPAEPSCRSQGKPSAQFAQKDAVGKSCNGDTDAEAELLLPAYMPATGTQRPTETAAPAAAGARPTAIVPCPTLLSTFSSAASV